MTIKQYYDRAATLTALANGEPEGLPVTLGSGRRDAALELASLINGLTPSESDRTHAAYGYGWAERKLLAYVTGVKFMRDAYWEFSSEVDTD